MFGEILNSKIGIIIISIIWGLGLSTLFRHACKGNNCQIVTYNGPNPKDIDGKYFEYGTGTCYQYEPYMIPC